MPLQVFKKTKETLILILTIVLLFNFIKFYSFFKEYSSWQYSDWLINYQGGFVRRGLIGEFFFQIHKITKIDLDLLVLSFVYILFILNFIIFFKSIKYLQNSFSEILIFLSPGLFLYPIMNSEVIGRKDILFISLFGLLIFFFNKIKSNFQLIVLIIVIYITSLSHSGFLFFSQYLIFFYFLFKISINKSLTMNEIIIILFNLIIIFFLILKNPAEQYQIDLICTSIKDFVSENCNSGGRVIWLKKTISYHIDYHFRNGLGSFIKSTSIYIISLVLVFIFIAISLYFSKFITSNKSLNKFNPLKIMMILFLFTIPVFILTIDWGRYISLAYSSTFFLYIFCIKNKLLKIGMNSKLFGSLSLKLFFVFVFIYSFTWTFPFYGANTFKFTLKKPYISIIKKINMLN